MYFPLCPVPTVQPVQLVQSAECAQFLQRSLQLLDCSPRRCCAALRHCTATGLNCITAVLLNCGQCCSAAVLQSPVQLPPCSYLLAGQYGPPGYVWPQCTTAAGQVTKLSILFSKICDHIIKAVLSELWFMFSILGSRKKNKQCLKTKHRCNFVYIVNF